MTREDVIRLMLEADPEMIINIKDHEEGMEGFTGEDPKLLQFWPFKNYVKFANLVAAAEREACEQICERQKSLYWMEFDKTGSDADRAAAIASEECADAIRARGQ